VSLALSLVGGHLHAQEEPNAAPPPDGGPPAGVPPPPPASPPAPSPPPAPASPPPLAPTELGRPVIDVRTPEPPPPEQRHYHMHDGFYLRGNVGLLFARTFVSSDQPAHPSYSVGDAGLSADLMIGGTPSVGFAVGGALSLESFGQASGPSSAGLGVLGVFVDGFPMESGGVHLGGLLGLAASRTMRPGDIDQLRAGGVGMAAWFGYDWWVSSEWSMGGLLRVNGAIAHDGSNDHGDDPYKLDSSNYGFAFMFSVLYH
jgi:hypothetical protein